MPRKKKKKVRNKNSLTPKSGAKRKRATKVAKPYNNGTMTASAFWGFIRSTLRQKSRWWKPITECKRLAKRPYKGTNKRQKYEYQCARCLQHFPDKDVQVHHKNPVGTLKSKEDLPEFVMNLFCEIGGLEVLCSGCHDETHAELNKQNNEHSTTED